MSISIQEYTYKNKKMKNIILLTTGLLLTLLFLILSATVFEGMYYEREFSNEMYNQGLYLPASLLVTCMAWGATATYYYLINSVNFSRWYHWLIMLIATSVLTTVCVHTYTDSALAEEGLSFSHQLTTFSGVCAIMNMVFFIIASFSLRWWSSNCRHTPIPE